MRGEWDESAWAKPGVGACSSGTPVSFGRRSAVLWCALCRSSLMLCAGRASGRPEIEPLAAGRRDGFGPSLSRAGSSRPLLSRIARGCQEQSRGEEARLK